jgi:hypothetical protein
MPNTEKTPKKATMIEKNTKHCCRVPWRIRRNITRERLCDCDTLTAEKVDAESMTKEELEETESIKKDVADTSRD